MIFTKLESHDIIDLLNVVMDKAAGEDWNNLEILGMNIYKSDDGDQHFVADIITKEKAECLIP